MRGFIQHKHPRVAPLPHVSQPNKRHTTTKTKTTAKIPINSLSTQPKRANPITNTHPNPDAPLPPKQNSPQKSQLTLYPHVPTAPPRCGRAPQPRRHTTPKTKHSVKIPINSLSTRPNRATPIADAHPNHDAPTHQKKNDAIHAPIPAIYNTVSINLAPSLRTHKRTKTNYKPQSTGLIRVFISPLHDIHHSNPEPDFSQKRIAPP